MEGNLDKEFDHEYTLGMSEVQALFVVALLHEQSLEPYFLKKRLLDCDAERLIALVDAIIEASETMPLPNIQRQEIFDLVPELINAGTQAEDYFRRIGRHMTSIFTALGINTLLEAREVLLKTATKSFGSEDEKKAYYLPLGQKLRIRVLGAENCEE